MEEPKTLMQGQDQREHSQPGIELPQQRDEQRQESTFETNAETNIASPNSKAAEFDWLALGIVVIIAAIFAGVARINTQPATSLTPIAVLSATGCGLLMTALRKLRTSSGAGLLEASIGGLTLALFQFIAALSYPNVLSQLGSVADERAAFLTTWLVILLLSIIFSVGGAAVGHLAFAPLRPLPRKTEPANAAEEHENEHGQADEEPAPSQKQISFLNTIVAVVLLGLAPTLVGIVFSAIFDYMLGVNHFLAGPYPTLRLLSALLPWQVAFPFNPGSSAAASLIVLEELWRIPLFIGNQSLFDAQALEPFIFNGAALALLLLTLRGPQQGNRGQVTALRWPPYLTLVALFGLLLVLPADLFIMRGLQGLLRTPLIVIPIRPLFLLNTLMFALNLISGPVICLVLALALRLLFLKQIQGRDEIIC
jgi:hypothetical protein